MDAHKTPLMCGLGVPVGCRMKHAKGMFKRWLLRAGKRPWKAFKGKRLRPGKWQAWTPITGCKGFKGFEGFKRFKGFGCF